MFMNLGKPNNSMHKWMISLIFVYLNINVTHFANHDYCCLESMNH